MGTPQRKRNRQRAEKNARLWAQQKAAQDAPAADPAIAPPEK
jgi:hypothetical protein